MSSQEVASDNADYGTPNPAEDTADLVVLGRDLVLPPGVEYVSWAAAVSIYRGTLESMHTKRAYNRHLEYACHYFEAKPIVSLTPVELAEYRQLVLEAGLAHASKAQALAALRGLLLWYKSTWGHPLAASVIRSALKSPRGYVQTPYTVLTDVEIQRLFDTITSVRDRTILGLLLGSGLRVAEVSSLDVRDLLQDEEGFMLVRVRGGKGNKDRLVPVREDVEDLLFKFLKATNRYMTDAGPLFKSEDRAAGSRKDPRLTPRSIGRIVKKWAALSGISAKRVTPHALRHSFGVRCIRRGANVVAVAKLLGHSSIQTTQRYVDHLELRELRQAVPDLPLGK